MSTLKIARGLVLPADVAGEAIAILAKRGAGKTNTGRVLVEELAAAKVQTVVLDPVGAWWGLRSSSDGKGAGLAMPILGGAHGDVPLQATAGALLADVVVDTGQSIVLDLSDFSKGDQRRFVTDFAERLYTRKARARGLLHLVLEEADEFVPQRVNAGDARMVGSIEQLVRRGRGRGIGLTMITQRSASLNKAVLTQADVLIVMRTTGPHDRKAIEAWVEKQDVDGADDVVPSLSSLETGEAWIWNPERNVLKRVQIRLARTFDSSSTPKAGETRVEPKQLAPIDLNALGAEIEATAERAKASDPAELQKRLRAVERERDRLSVEKANLERQLEKSQEGGGSARVADLEAEVARVTAIAEELDQERAAAITWWEDEHLKLAGRILDRTHALYEEGLTELQGLRARSEDTAASREAAPVRKIAKLEPVSRAAIERAEPQPRRQPAAASSSNDDVQVKAGARRIVETLARHYPMRVTRAQLGTLTGFKITGGTFQTYFSQLKRLGLIVDNAGEISVTDAGLEFAGVVAAEPMSTDEMLAMWRSALKAGARAMLDQLVAHYPTWLSKEQLAELVEMTPTGGTYQTYLSTLRRNGLVDVDGGEVRASATLFIGAAA